MIEVKEIARLYTAQSGFTLVVGKLDHSLDLERTAAKAYYHLSNNEDCIYIGRSVKDLRVCIERSEDTSVTPETELIESILYRHQQEDIAETQVYSIDAGFTQIKLINLG